jgi:SRSO17 transposase
VFLGYASRYGRALIDRALYLPESWAQDAARRTEAGIADAVGFVTKPKLGRAMLERALEHEVPCAWAITPCAAGCRTAGSVTCWR